MLPWWIVVCLLLLAAAADVGEAKEPVTLDICQAKIFMHLNSGGNMGNALHDFTPLYALRNLFDLVLLIGNTGHRMLNAAEAVDHGRPEGDPYWRDVVKLFPNMRSYMLGQPLRGLDELLAATKDSNVSCVAGRVLEQARAAAANGKGWNVYYFSMMLKTAAEGKTEWYIEQTFKDAFLRDPPPDRASLPTFAASKEVGDGSWWFNYPYFIGPQLDELRSHGLKDECSAVLDADDQALCRDEELFAIHVRNFREEHLFGHNVSYQRTRDLLVQKPTFRPSYLVALARHYGAKKVLVVTEPHYLKHTDEIAVFQDAGFDFFGTRSRSFFSDFCFLMKMRGTLVINHGSTFSYWAAILGDARLVVIPRVLGERANAEHQRSKPHRDLWPVNDLRFSYVDAWHGGIDTRYPNGTELTWVDYYHTNGTRRAKPITWPLERDEMTIESHLGVPTPDAMKKK